MEEEQDKIELEKREKEMIKVKLQKLANANYRNNLKSKAFKKL